uniref:Uncharacterized protein n=1 Tax=Neogobius melanostomus TaxID=47308 RepID=A0A8C6WKW1_9GOBI
MLRENSENAVQTGTFAQEIITLVHKVKDQYFGGQGITLTERFSTIKMEENEEPQEMTLNKRFSLLGSPPLRDPDDLRHDLEKRRQERRQEGVKITIAGQSRPQRPQQPKPLECKFMKNKSFCLFRSFQTGLRSRSGGRKDQR